MAPLIPIAIKLASLFAPTMIAKLAGEGAGDVARDVVNVAMDITGAPDHDSALEALNADPALAMEFKLKMAELEVRVVEAAASTIQAEIASDSWLAKNWRPITMLVFVSIVVSRMYGFTSTNIAEAEYLAVYDLIKIGLTGYVVSRSAEKIVPSLLTKLVKSFRR